MPQGYNILWNWNQGKCGVCGDSVTDPAPRLHETGGKFGNKIITATYEEGVARVEDARRGHMSTSRQLLT